MRQLNSKLNKIHFNLTKNINLPNSNKIFNNYYLNNKIKFINNYNNNNNNKKNNNIL